MKIKIVYKDNRSSILSSIFFDDYEVRGVTGYSVSQSVNEAQTLHLDIVAFEGVKIEYAEEKT